MLIASRFDPLLYSCTACPSSRGGAHDDELTEDAGPAAGRAAIPVIANGAGVADAGPSFKGMMPARGTGRSGRMRFCLGGMQSEQVLGDEVPESSRAAPQRSTGPHEDVNVLTNEDESLMPNKRMMSK